MATMTRIETIEQYRVLESQALATTPNADDYAAADRRREQEYERLGRVAKRGGEFAPATLSSGGVSPEMYERYAQLAAFSRVMFAAGVKPPVQALKGNGPDMAFVLTEMPADDLVISIARSKGAWRQTGANILVATPTLTVCDWVPDVDGALVQLGYQTTYWWGDRSRSHLVRGYYLTGRDLRAKYRVIDIVIP